MVFKNDLVCFSSREEMSERLSDLVVSHLSAAIGACGDAQLAASGGSTPVGLYQALSRRSLDWKHVTAVLADERWVPMDHEASNEGLVRKTLKTGAAEALNICGLYDSELSPSDAADMVEKRLTETPGALDVAILGMGTDGHTASWFPHCQGLDRALASKGPRVTNITANPSKVTGNYLDRITLTLSAIKNARLILLLLTGDEKRSAFENYTRDGAIEEAPVRAILQARKDIWVCWAP